MSATHKNRQLSMNLSRVLKQLVAEGTMIYAYHWDPPELDLYLGDEQPCHLEVTREVWEHTHTSRELKKWIKGHMPKNLQ